MKVVDCNFNRFAKVSAAAAIALGLMSGAAYAGQCPAGKEAKDVKQDETQAAKDVTDNVLAHIDLSKEKVAVADRLFRLRRLEVKPGGIVPFHSHGDRPAIIYIVSGQMTEHSTKCSVPIVHKAGEVAMESIGLSHWWQNNGKETAVLLSADIFHTKMDDANTM